MTESLISYRERRGGPVLGWARREGERTEIRESAEHLLGSLRDDEYLAQSMVYVDGRAIRRTAKAPKEHQCELF